MVKIVPDNAGWARTGTEAHIVDFLRGMGDPKKIKEPPNIVPDFFGGYRVRAAREFEKKAGFQAMPWFYRMIYGMI